MGFMPTCGQGNMMVYQGIILAGGKSRRFGEDKAMAKIGERTLLEYSIKLLRDLKMEPTLIANDLQDYSHLNVRIEKDKVPGKGPLGGLYTASRIYPHSALLVLTCDMPALFPSILQNLMQYHQKEHGATIFKIHENSYQPFPGIYEAELEPLFRQAIEWDRLSLQDFLPSIPELRVVESKAEESFFVNVNRKEDLESYKKAGIDKIRQEWNYEKKESKQQSQQ